MKTISINELEEINDKNLLLGKRLGELHIVPHLSSIPMRSDEFFISMFKEHITIETNKYLTCVYKLSDDYILDNCMNIYECIFINE